MALGINHKVAVCFSNLKLQHAKNCKVKAQCTKSIKNGKVVQRRQHSQIIQANKERVEQNKTTYKRRQAIVEHPYGTIKRQWGFNYILTKQGIERAESDVGLICIAYNLRRLMNIITPKGLQDFLKALVLVFLANIINIKLKIKGFKKVFIFSQNQFVSIFFAINP